MRPEIEIAGTVQVLCFVYQLSSLFAIKINSGSEKINTRYSNAYQNFVCVK